MKQVNPPNIVFIISDDHARNAVGCYGSRYGSLTPNIDRIATEGARLDNLFNTNALCSPSRACILTGAYGHVNGVTANATPYDSSQDSFPKRLQAAGYQTAVFGKWHLGAATLEDPPTGFDTWAVLPGQGDYVDPTFLEPDAKRQQRGYVTDVITDKSLDWLEQRNPEKPFLLWIGHKAPHRSWEPDLRHADLWEEREMPEPETLFDDYEGRVAAFAAKMRIHPDLHDRDLKGKSPPEGCTEEEQIRWKYQQHIKDYLRVSHSMDQNIGRVLDFLDEQGLRENTIVVYTADHGLFLGEHGWFDKRFMYEEALCMPGVIRYPAEIAAGTELDDMILNLDFCSSFLDYAGVEDTKHNQGQSIRSLLRGEKVEGWRQSMYYRYWAHKDWSHHCYAHRGIRNQRYKLIHFYNHGEGIPDSQGGAEPEFWEFYDLQVDPYEVKNLIEDPGYADEIQALKQELEQLRTELKDQHPDEMQLSRED